MLALPSEIPVMPGDLPLEQHVLHLRAGADVVHDHVTAAEEAFLVYDDADVSQSATQVRGPRTAPLFARAGVEIPGDQISRGVVFRAIADGQRLAFAAEEDHQVGHAEIG